jgi:LAO/AO transport system kinase
MEAHADDAGVFIRSLASRGHLGGLSRATGQVVDLLDAVGFDTILVETVGVGQSELSVMEVADTVVVVLTPESGDTVQTMKAGLLEVGDIFVVNKADRPGADRLSRELEQMVQLDSRFAGAFGVTRGVQAECLWEAPVYASSALNGEGISDVMKAAQTHRDWCAGQGRPAWTARRASGRVRTFLDLAAEAGRTAAVQIIDADQGRLREELMQGLNPYELAASVGGE